jgi:hypothetical protein
MFKNVGMKENGLWTLNVLFWYRSINRWTELKTILQGVNLVPDCSDSVKWALESKGYFTTKSLYRFLTNRGVISRVAGFIWKCKFPLKIKFFLWQAFNNKLHVTKSLAKRGWKGDIHCCLCGLIESVDHLLFKCHLARLIWSTVKEIFNLEFCPSSLEEFSCIWLQGKGPLPSNLLMFVFAGIAWALWTQTR